MTPAEYSINAIEAGLAPAYLLLKEAGYEVVIENQWGLGMILTIPLHFEASDRLAAQVWISADLEHTEPYLFNVSRKRIKYLPDYDGIADIVDDSDLATKHQDDLVGHVRWLIDNFEENDGIELQWVDTNDLTNGQPRVLTFDECAMRGLDGTGRTS